MGQTYPASVSSYTPVPSGGTQNVEYGSSRKHGQRHNDHDADIAALQTHVGPATNGVAGTPSGAPHVGYLLLPHSDGSTEWLPAHLFSSPQNPSFERWSRGTSVAVAASISTIAGYGPDGWCLKTNANQASHWTRVAGLTDPSQYAAKVGRDAGQTGTGVMVAEQPYTLDEIVKHRGDYLSLNLPLKAGANWSPSSGNLTIRVACGTGAAARRAGSAYASETTLISQTVSLTTSVQTFSFVSSVIVPTNATQMSICYEWTPAGTAGADDTFTVDDVQLNRGPIPMPFKARPDDEWQCLKRVFVLKPGANSKYPGVGWASSTTNVAIDIPFPAPMIGPPVLTAGGAAADYSLSDNVNALVTANAVPTLPVADAYHAYLAVTAASGLTQYRPYYLYTTTGSGQLAFSADL